jgi:creatinine amidohydrolase
MDKAVDTEAPPSYFPGGHMDTSVDPYGRPSRWSETEGHIALELLGRPEGVVGKAAQATAKKARRPMAAIIRYLTLLHDEILEAYPSGKVPPVEMTTLRDPKDLEPYLREPQSPGWKSVYGLPQIGQIQ